MVQNCCKTIELPCICAGFAQVVRHFGMVSITLLGIIPEPILRFNCDERRFFIFSRPAVEIAPILKEERLVEDWL